MSNPVKNLSAQVQSFWAKTGDKETPVPGMSLPQHMLDSAMVAQRLWECWLSEGSKLNVAEKLGLTPEDACAFVAWVVGTHDIGKATPEFSGQLDSRQNQELFVYRQKIEDAGYEFPVSLTNVQGRCAHSQYSQSIITSWLTRVLGDEAEPVETAAQTVAHISGAHHGLPADRPTNICPDRRDEQLLEYVDDYEKYANWGEAWKELLGFITEQTGAKHALRQLINGGGGIPAELQFFLTGLTIMSDWIASNADYFPYETNIEDQNLRIETAFSRLALNSPWQPSSLKNLEPEEIYSQRFGWEGDINLRPMQRVAIEAARSLPHGGLICIEAPMGQGKTEAGLVAAEILAHRAGKNGLMFAAPSQATADALFTRVDQWAQRAAATSECVSMYLAHSKNQLNEEFKQKRFARINTSEPGTDSHQFANVVAHQWFSKKRGVLSNFVVGTVDQVLMMALASRHVMLRHLGLSEKVIIIDEVHAYDAYMNVYLINALKWLGKMRAPVVLMSATLPSATRKKLLDAYALGLHNDSSRKRRPSQGQPPAPQKVEVDLSYPVIHTVSADSAGVPQKWVIEQPPQQQEFSVRVMDDSFAELDSVLAPLETDGGCAAIICNTVGRAQEVYEHLQGTFTEQEVMLVHSRFLALDRVAMEQNLVSKLGKKARHGAGRPHRLIVVGTQVIEQSLDIDFDVMITDHAPVDLILQRMGRLHRHERAGQRPEVFERPICYVRGVEQLGSESKPPTFVKAAELIYAKAFLLSSYAQLMPYFEGKQLRIPADISALVQQAYMDSPTLPTSWANEWDEAQQKLKEQQNIGVKKAGVFSMQPGKDFMFDYFGKGGRALGTDSDEAKAQAKVRDTDETLEVIVVQADTTGEQYRPLSSDYKGIYFDVESPEKPDWKLANILAGSTIRLPHQFADNGKPAAENPFDKALGELERNYIPGWQQHYLLKDQLTLMLDANYECLLAGKKIRYSQELGLQVSNNE
ncbi:CRISPR-associated helicase Cas3' [Rothia sp. ZJ1223]|uniref:CRISPR-associated helicase Cas3' n=1 Tax=Rothia sp. ZJ1223 TaxID=2811098 RepID=UPI0021028841|nr:CRISPR-associated helicase Cas3' [Rothia sp. ZJ1223]